MKARNFQTYWCQAMIERLVFLGFDHFFVAPGSRSTPLVSAIARHEKAHVYQSIDERSLAFMALGYAKRSKKAGVIVVTSGTAVANLYPAVVEAYVSSVPLLIISADRPYELRDTGANQTIFQPHIFFEHCKKSFDLAPPLDLVSIKKSQSIFDQALLYAHDMRPGPVHINIQLREPLHNRVSEEKWDEAERLEHRLSFAKASSDLSELKQLVQQYDTGLIVAGENYPGEVQKQILRLAEKLQWPVFADISSNLCFADHPLIFRHFDLALLNQEFLAEFKPELIVHIGDRVVSKRYWAWIEKNQACRYLRLSEYSLRVDPIGIFQHFVTGEIAVAIGNIADSLPIRKSPNSKSVLFCQDLAHKVTTFLDNKADNEAFFAAELILSISEPTNLFVSSSMPVRDLDQCAPKTPILIDVFVNRGASGIDGIISTAAGMAVASHKPNILLIGDVAFLHDTNGLMLLQSIKQPVLIVLINNSGGGIFHFLPISDEPEVLTPFLDTPHKVDIALLAKAHGIPYSFADAENFAQAIASFFREKKTQILEIVINKETNVALHKAFYRSLSA